MTIRVMAQKSGDVTAESHRLALQALFAPAGMLNARTGILANAGTPADLVGTGALTANVTAFQAWIDGSSNALQGGYLFTNDATAAVTFAAGSGTNPRYDMVVARIRDNPYDASGSQTGTIEVVQGTPAASPSLPATPASSLLLWAVLVPANASGGNPINFASARSDLRQYTGLAGVPFPVANSTFRDAIASPYAGMAVYRLDSKTVERYDGSAWVVEAGLNSPNVQQFTASGTWTKPAGAKWVRVRGQAPGGPGGGAPATGASQASSSGGGGGGGYFEFLVAASVLGATEAVTIGPVGTGASGAGGTAGGDVSFGAHATANGGLAPSTLAAGSSVSWATGGEGGAATIFTAAALAAGFTVQGSDGQFGQRIDATAVRGGHGGSAFMGGGQRPSNNPSGTGFAGQPYGGGASGSSNDASSAAKTGPNGGAGICIVETYYA